MRNKRISRSRGEAMSIKRKTMGDISRRSFLKSSAVAVGAASLLGGSSVALRAIETIAQEPEQVEEIFSCACRGTCTGNCLMDITVRDGVIVKSRASKRFTNEDYARLCARGQTHPQRVYSEDRVKYPVRRIEGTERGAGEWERISWDEAAELIKEKWSGYVEEYGVQSIATYSFGGNSANSANYHRAWSSLSGVTSINGQIDRGAGTGSANIIGNGKIMQFSNDLSDLPNAKNLFFWGIDAGLSRPNNMPFLYRARENGGKCVVVDPCYTGTVARFADIHVPLRPGTDSVLAMAMMHVAIEEGLVDESFMQSRTVAPFLVKKSDGLFLREYDVDGSRNPDDPPILPLENPPAAMGLGGPAPSNGLDYDNILVCTRNGTTGLASEVTDPLLTGTFTFQGIEVTTAYDLLKERLEEYPLSRCIEICDIGEETIRKITRIFADGPTTTVTSYGMDHYYNSNCSYESLMALGCITGQVRSKGASIGHFTTSGAPGIDCMPRWMMSHRRLSDRPAKRVTATDLAETLEAGELDGEPFTLKSLYITFTNPVANWCDRQHTLRAFGQIEFIIVSELVWSETAQYADLVLPACHYVETEDILNGPGGDLAYYAINEKVIEPLYESKDDLYHINLLYDALGMSDCTIESKEAWNEFTMESNALKSFGVTFERLREEKVIQLYDEFPEAWPRVESNFGTLSGRGEFYQESPYSNSSRAVKFDRKLVQLPYFITPHEAWRETVGGFEMAEAARKYPLQLCYNRSRFGAHTSYSYVPWLNELDGEPYIRINPEDAAARGIKHNNMVRVFNDRGFVVMKAYVDNGIRPGMTLTPQRWQAPQWVEGNLSDLTNRAHDTYFENQNYKDAVVEIERYKEV
jgi:molybdopterin-containing oxidoreductase family molybdopterin binding subunit